MATDTLTSEERVRLIAELHEKFGYTNKDLIDNDIGDAFADIEPIVHKTLLYAYHHRFTGVGNLGINNVVVSHKHMVSDLLVILLNKDMTKHIHTMDSKQLVALNIINQNTVVFRLYEDRKNKYQILNKRVTNFSLRYVFMLIYIRRLCELFNQQHHSKFKVFINSLATELLAS